MYFTSARGCDIIFPMTKRLDDLCSDFLGRARRDGLTRELRLSALINGGVSFASNDYLGLSTHPRVIEAARIAAGKYGSGSRASRLLSGNLEVHEELESILASFKGREAALAFVSGYSANLGTIPAIVGKGDVVFSDASNHASIIDGIRLSGARAVVYEHLDMADLESKLKKERGGGRALVVTDTLFSMEGDLAPLGEIVGLAEKFDALTMIDDAHATGVIGETGRGGEERFGVTGRVDAVMGTMSKALGSQGGFVAGSEKLRQLLVNSSRSFIYSTGIAPAAAASATEAIRILKEDDSLLKGLRENISYFKSLLCETGFPVKGEGTPIFLLTLGDERKAVEAGERLLDAGIYVPPVRYPTVPRGKAALRISLSAKHARSDLERLAALLKEVIERSETERP